MINYGGYFDTDQKIIEMKMLEDKINDPSIWNDRESANKTIKRCSDLKRETSEIIDLRNEINENILIAFMSDMQCLKFQIYYRVVRF